MHAYTSFPPQPPDVHSGGPPRWRDAFTLIEGVAVVAIVALLVAIVVPSVGRAREQAKASRCQANLHALGAGFQAYADANEGVLPHEDDDDNLTYLVWYKAIDPFIGLADALYKADSGTAIDPDDPAQYDLFDQTKGTFKICPSVDPTARTRVESYKMNGRLEREAKLKNVGMKGMPFRDLSTIVRPALTVVLFDGKVGGKAVKFKGNRDDVKFRHRKEAQFLFADWHTAPFDKVTVRRYSRDEADPSRAQAQLIWNPDPADPLGDAR